MVKITLENLRDASMALSKILTQPMAFKLSYRLLKMTKKIRAEQKDLEDARMELVKKYGKKDERGAYTVPPEKIEKFMDEFNTVLEEEISLDIPPIPQDLIEEADIKLSAVELASIELFLGQEEQKAPQKPKPVA
jgi:hypothetical protein